MSSAPPTLTTAAPAIAPRLNSARPFALLLLVQIALWTLLPISLFRSPPMDVAELVYWGHEKTLGTYKHPPLPAWIADAVFGLAHQVWPLYLLAQLTLAATILALYRLARRVLPQRDALIASAAALTLYSVVFVSPEFNNNAAMEPFWILAILATHRALTQSAKAKALAWWLATGLFLALAAWCKYSAATLAASIAVALIATREGRAALRTPGPYLAAAATLAVLSPHLWWLKENDFISFAYAGSRPVRGHTTAKLLNLLEFVAALGANLAPATLCLLPILYRPFTRRASRKPLPGGGVEVGEEQPPSHEGRTNSTEPPRPTLLLHPTPLDRRFIAITTLGPILIHIAAAVALNVGLRATWASALSIPLPLLLLTRLHTRARGTRPALLAVITVNLALAASLIIYSEQTPRSPHITPRTAYPMPQLAREVQQRWQQQTQTPGPPAIIGEPWLASETALYLTPRPHVSAAYNNLADSRPYNSRIDPWLPPDRVAHGAVILWWLASEGPPTRGTINPVIAKLFPGAIEQDPIELNYPGSDPPSRVRVGFAIIKPD